MDFHTTLDLLAHNFPEINCFNADLFLEKNRQELSSIAQKYFETAESNIVIEKAAWDLFAPGLEGFNSEVIYDIFYSILISNHRYHRKNSFENYSKSQPLFCCYPELIEKISIQGKKEYLPVTELRYEGMKISCDNVKFTAFSYKNHYFSVPYMSADLMNYLLDIYFDNLLVHVSPYHIYKIDQTQSYIEKGVLRPINPKYINNFRLQKGYTGGLYDFSYMNDKLKHNEIYVRSFSICQTTLVNSQGLEVIVIERKNDMSMMIEELVINRTENHLVGYCIHLDILNALGKNLTKMKINHIDLAINIYEGQDMLRRVDEKLCDGKKTTDATYRTHLLRIENIPFLDMIKIASMFLQSQCLVMDWIDDQFPDNIYFQTS